SSFGAYPDCPPQIHETDSGKELAVLKGHTGPVVDVVFHPDGRRVVTASLDGTVRVWEGATGKPLRSIGPGDGGVIAAVLAPDGRGLLTLGDGKIHSFVVKPPRVG